ncbi:uncharacterized protein LOC100142093 [Tribolium castaneum]|nr:PREDICTED: uncharacterized protein LOC100142093 [Tribolium castaneum]|eukprot:XP_001809624.1 PREDICTED: uncharacterized protein LOC100142093 [Tribolium castaneum]
MTIQQMFVALLCSLLATQQIAAVVNNSKSASIEESSNKTASAAKIPDSVSSASEQEAKRRDAPLSDTYGAPLSGGGIDSYVPSGPSNPGLPIPVYGVPDAPSNNIVYPAPPPDIPPPLPQISSSYGVPFKTYGPPQLINNFDLGHSTDFVPPPPPTKYLPPIRSHKPFSAPKLPRPRPHYGPPQKPIFVPKLPKPNYGPPKSVYGPPKQPLFVPQKTNFKQQSVTIVTVPSNNYGVPNLGHGQDAFISPPAAIGHGHYGPPDPVPHAPPPGVPAPPTPPDIKYDGWQPIPGLVSRPPDTYGAPEVEHHGTADLQVNTDFIPPPVDDGHGSASLGLGYSPPSQGISDSYGAPLNSVTGSGAVVSSSGDAHHDDESLSLGLSAAGIHSGQSHLSVIKSIGYEIFPNTGGGLSHTGDTYSSPPLDSYSLDGPYAAAQAHKSNGLSSFSFGGSIKSHGLRGGHGLIPPSGLYGAPPSSHYGTPLLAKPTQQYGPPLNALKINPPKHPVIFREPVPQGLIQSIGQHTAHKDAHGIIESTHSSSFSSGPTYIPPPIPDVTKPVKEEEPPSPSGLYSLPHAHSAVSFQNVAHGSSFDFGSSHFGGGQPLTSYTAPLGSIDGSYGLPVHSASGYSVAVDNAPSGGLTVGIDNSHPPVTIDLTSATSNVGPSFAHLSHGYGYQNVHDCSSHKSQPLPSLSYGVPSANTYTASLSSLTTNIGGSYHGDLQTAHSQKVSTGVSYNAIHNSSEEKNYGKSLAQKFGPGAELIQSQSLDINNIPVQGSLGSYTLQIQSADGLNGRQSSSGPVPHAQVLNDGLLHSILAAIEQPQSKNTKILGQPLAKLQPSESYSGSFESDSDGQHSVTNAVAVPSPVTEATSTTTTTQEPESESETDTPLHLIDDNEIALYFSNNLQDADNGSQKNDTSDGVLNGQQYGSYVSFKTPNASFVYGNLPSDKSQERQDKD